MTTFVRDGLIYDTDKASVIAVSPPRYEGNSHYYLGHSATTFYRTENGRYFYVTRLVKYKFSWLGMGKRTEKIESSNDWVMGNLSPEQLANRMAREGLQYNLSELKPA